MHTQKVTKLGLQKNYICPKTTKMGSVINFIDHRMDYNGVGVLSGQQVEKIDQCNPSPPGRNMPLYNHNLY